MSNTGGSHKRTRKARTSRSSQDSLAVQSGRSYEGMPGNNSTTSSRATSNGSYGNQSQSPALQDYVRRLQREDPWAPENALHAYSQRPDGTYNSPYNSSPGNSQYNNSYSSSPVYDPYNNQYNNSYNNDPYNSPYNSPHNNPYNSNPYTNDTYTNNPANGSSDVPSYANRNGRIVNGDSNNSRSNNTYGSNYDTAYGRSSNSENNQNNTSNNRSRNNSRR